MYTLSDTDVLGLAVQRACNVNLQEASDLVINKLLELRKKEPNVTFCDQELLDSILSDRRKGS